MKFGTHVANRTCLMYTKNRLKLEKNKKFIQLFIGGSVSLVHGVVS